MSYNWDKKYLGLALFVAGWSKDPSTKVGAVIVGPKNEVRSLGFNGPPRDVNDDVPERWERQLKYQICEHAERNAIYNAARVGTPTEGCTIYVTSFPTKFGPCDNCCRAIIQAGIVRVVQEPPQGDAERWRDSFQVGEMMLKEAGIPLRYIALDKPCEHLNQGGYVEAGKNEYEVVTVWRCNDCGSVL